MYSERDWTTAALSSLRYTCSATPLKTHCNNKKMSSPEQVEVQHDFLSSLSKREIDALTVQVGQFVVAQGNLRPICLVSSGGTAVDLEVHAVRCLENFSTGLRGSISVEEFLQRGYAVVHLWRRGSASPFARVIGQQIGLQQSNHGLSVESLGRLFAIAGEDSDDDLVQTVLEKEIDPWMTMTQANDNEIATCDKNVDGTKGVTVSLNRRLIHSSAVQKALQARSSALGEGRLITVPFRTVEEYLAKLQICCQSLSLSKSLAMVFLAAAVSDFYIPQSEKAKHKIQSGANEDGLLLHLKSVPKTLGLIRTAWAPDAFVVTFKLETDKDILRQKAERSVAKYGCHMIIGNLLQTRHHEVWILAPQDFRCKASSDASAWPMKEITESSSSTVDSLESSIIDYVVQSHFEFISWHFKDDASGIHAMKQAQERIWEERETIRRRLFWNKTKRMGLELVGALFTMWISYTINSTLQRRRHCQ
jgi:phosphopantothenate---cysteine ligase (ATP)